MAWMTRSRKSRWGVPGGVPSHEDEPRRAQRILRGQGDEPDAKHGQHGLVALAHDEQVVAALPVEHRLGRALDGVGRAQPDPRGGAGYMAGASSSRCSTAFSRTSAGALPSKTIGPG